jgi:uroporphyrinogen decarboxylase
MNISHTERVRACLTGEKPDRPPVVLWRHFPVDDQSPGALAEATLQFQTVFDFDLVKVTPASSFCLKDWGAQDEWAGDTEGTRRYTQRVIKNPQDWECLAALEPTAPHLAAQLDCLRLIRAGLPLSVPLIQTIFSPLAQAKNLAGGETLLAHLRLYPEALRFGLRVIAETTRRFVEAARDVGLDGIFYAIQHAQASLLSLAEYETFGLPFDHLVLEPASDLWCNMLHLHGRQIHFDPASRLPFQIVNWHDRETTPTLSEAKQQFDGVVCGGMRQETLVLRDQAAIRAEAEDAIRQTGGQRFILGTGCVVPVIAAHGNLVAARRSVEL